MQLMFVMNANLLYLFMESFGMIMFYFTKKSTNKDNIFPIFIAYEASLDFFILLILQYIGYNTTGPNYS